MTIKSVLGLGFALSLGVLTGCSDDAQGRDGDGVAFAGSCEGFCGGEAPQGCFCDPSCVEEGDCCTDYTAVCSVEAACGDEDEHDDDDDDDDVDDADNDDADNDDADNDDDVVDNSGRACFLGEDRSGTTCFDVVDIQPYTYPSPLNNNYRKPIRFIDVEAVDLGTKIAPNWKLSEISVPYKGRYQVVQPHAVAKLQDVRDDAGALSMKSGFRSPTYNAQQPGAASRSRHMYGDAFDLIPQSTSQNNLYNICNSHGAGYVAKYTSGHVHCDWRNVSIDPLFYGSTAVASAMPLHFTLADLEVHIETDGETFWVNASGYDTEEGELTRVWTALDAEGATLATAETLTFAAPAATAVVRVDVGGLAEYESEISDL